MKKKYSLLSILCVISAFILFSCSGKEDDAEDTRNITISTNLSSIVADGLDKAVITVTCDGLDVTNKSEIFEAGAGKIESNIFSTKVEGGYTFYAKYDGVRTKDIEINAIATENVKSFTRHIAVFKFTGTWCTWCPEGGRRLDYILTNSKYENAHILAFHGGESSEPMLVPETDILFNDFRKVGIDGYPAVVIDMREGNTNIKMEDTKSALNRSISDYPAYYSVGIESVISGNKANVDVSINNSISDKYRIVVYVVENGLVHAQKEGQLITQNFIHDHVVRKLASKTAYGDATPSVEIGDTYNKKYEIEIDPEWDLENTKVYALVISDKTGFIHNMALCDINGGKMEHED